MKRLALTFLLCLAGVLAFGGTSETTEPFEEPTWDSFRRYECPEWFRDAIYSTRPWKTFWEGPAVISEGHLANLKCKGFCAEDVRFTQSKDGKALYVHCLEKPEGDSIPIKSLGVGAGHLASDPEKVTMPGSDAKIQWSRTADAMTLMFPEELPGEHVYVFKFEL